MSTRAGARPEVGAARRWRWESVGNYLSAPPCLLIQRINSVCNHRYKPKPGGLRSAFTCWPNFTFEGCLLSAILEVNFQPQTMMGRILFPRGGVKGDEKKRCIHEEESL